MYYVCSITSGTQFSSICILFSLLGRLGSICARHYIKYHQLALFPSPRLPRHQHAWHSICSKGKKKQKECVVPLTPPGQQYKIPGQLLWNPCRLQTILSLRTSVSQVQQIKARQSLTECQKDRRSLPSKEKS